MSQKQRSIGAKTAPAGNQAEESALIGALLEGLNDRCAAQVRLFIKANERAQRGHLAEMWVQGKIVEALKNKEYRSPREGDKMVNTMAVLAQAGDCSESYLNKMAQFYRLFPSEAEKAQILDMRMRNGKRLIYAHWEQLVKFAPASPEDSRDQFDAMVRKTVDNSWTPLELAGHIKMTRDANQETTRGGGRPNKVPATFHGKLAKLVKQSEVLLKTVTSICVSSDKGLIESLKTMSQTEIAEEADGLMAGVRTLAANLQSIGDWCSEMGSGALPELTTYINKCACASSAEAGKDAAEAIEKEDAA